MTCKSILVVEDNNDIRETVEDVLRTEGYRVHAVGNGREAIQALKRIDGPCLILLDMMMPLFNGWEFLEAQKNNARFADLPVVVMSALDAQTALVRGSSVVAARGYIRKPIDLDVLMRIVQDYCEPPVSQPAA